MKFVMSYSCGKDSTLALHRMLAQGHQPVGILVMMNEKMKRSWFHGADDTLILKISDALEIPPILCVSDGKDYNEVMEKGLRKAAQKGAEAAVFGDIDIEDHRKWNRQRCEAAGLDMILPLWHLSRKTVVNQILEEGYRCVIKSIDNTILPESLLGKILDVKAVEIIRKSGADICGENGEYHTIAVDGPVFHHPLVYHTGEIIRFGGRSVIDIK